MPTEIEKNQQSESEDFQKLEHQLNLNGERSLKVLKYLG